MSIEVEMILRLLLATAENTFEKPNQVETRETTFEASGKSFTYSFEPHSVTALVCAVS